MRKINRQSPENLCYVSNVSLLTQSMKEKNEQLLT